MTARLAVIFLLLALLTVAAGALDPSEPDDCFTDTCVGAE